jgi:hypothetical protein
MNGVEEENNYGGRRNEWSKRGTEAEGMNGVKE